MPTIKTPELPAVLLQLLAEAFDRRSWHGTNLRGSIRGLSAKDAAWRLAPNRHSIAQIVVHCAYWKYAVRRRLRGDKRGSFAIKGSNWFTLPEPISERDWKGYVELLLSEHAALREVVAALPARQLQSTPPGSKTSCGTLIRGVALHDVYHAGQIQVIKRMRR